MIYHYRERELMKSLLSIILFFAFTSKIYAYEREEFLLDFTAKLSGNIPNRDLFRSNNKNVNDERFINYSLTCKHKFHGCVLTVFSMLNSFCGENMKKPNKYENGYYSNAFDESMGLEVFGYNKNQIHIIYTDMSFWGRTENSLIVKYRKKTNIYDYDIIATNIEGKAFTLISTLGGSISADYSILDKPINCQVNFIPTVE